MVKAAIAALVLGLATACGGGPKAAAVPTLAATPLPRSTAPTAIVLYKNGAWVTVRRQVDAPAGRSVVEVPLPERLDASAIAITEVTGATVAALTLPAPRDRMKEYSGQVEAMLGHYQASGIDFEDLTELDPGDVPPPPPVDVPTVRVTLDSPGGRATLELSYWTTALRWSTGYTVYTDGAKGVFDGALVVTQPEAVDLGVVAVSLVDGDASLVDGASASDDGDDDEEGGYYDDDGEWHARTRRKPTANGELPPPLLVADGIQLAGVETRLQLPGAHEDVTVAELLVVDAVGSRLDLSVRNPRRLKEYGANEGNTPPVEQSYEFALPATLRRADIPAGTLRLYGRRGDQLRPLGEAQVGDAALAEDTAVPKTTIRVGNSSKVTATRKQTDFALDTEGKRLIEEITVELNNKGDAPVTVLVREHLYRGLNWSLGYYSEASLEKEGPQQIGMRATVAPGVKHKVTYRVIYTW